MAKKSVSYSDEVVKYPVASSSEEFSNEEVYPFEGITEYTEEEEEEDSLIDHDPSYEDDSVSPLREPFKNSNQSKQMLSSFKKSAGKSSLKANPKFGIMPSILKKQNTAILPASEDSSNFSDEESSIRFNPNLDDSIGNGSVSGLSDFDSDALATGTTPRYSKLGGGSSGVSESAIAKNREKLREFASILDQIKPSTMKVNITPNDLSDSSLTYSSRQDLHNLSAMSKISAVDSMGEDDTNSLDNESVSGSSIEMDSTHAVNNSIDKK